MVQITPGKNANNNIYNNDIGHNNHRLHHHISIAPYVVTSEALYTVV